MQINNLLLLGDYEVLLDYMGDFMKLLVTIWMTP